MTCLFFAHKFAFRENFLDGLPCESASLEKPVSLLCGYSLLQNTVYLLIAYDLKQRDPEKDLHEIQSTHCSLAYVPPEM
jgi:hypothetical protein